MHRPVYGMFGVLFISMICMNRTESECAYSTKHTRTQYFFHDKCALNKFEVNYFRSLWFQPKPSISDVLYINFVYLVLKFVILIHCLLMFPIHCYFLVENVSSGTSDEGKMAMFEPFCFFYKHWYVPLLGLSC